MTILTIAGSPSISSRSAKLLEKVRDALDQIGARTRNLELRSLPADALLRANVRDPAVAQALELVASAEVIVLATPIYKAAYSGLLKVFLDLLPQRGFEGKYVWPLASGGSLAHALAIDYALRPVLTTLSATQVGHSVFALDSEIDVTSDGSTQLSLPLQARINDGIAHLRRHLDLEFDLPFATPLSPADFQRQPPRCVA